MAFQDGLHNRVAIYPLLHREGNRSEKNQLKTGTDGVICNVPCRIIRQEKVLFEPDVSLSSGDRLVDLADNVTYEIMKVQKIYGRDKLHHISCEIRVWGLDGQHTNRNG